MIMGTPGDLVNICFGNILGNDQNDEQITTITGTITSNAGRNRDQGHKEEQENMSLSAKIPLKIQEVSLCPPGYPPPTCFDDLMFYMPCNINSYVLSNTSEFLSRHAAADSLHHADIVGFRVNHHPDLREENPRGCRTAGTAGKGFPAASNNLFGGFKWLIWISRWLIYGLIYG